MMKNTTSLAVVLIAAIALLLGIYIVNTANSGIDEREVGFSDDDTARPGVAFEEGVIMVRLPEAVQQRAGIATANPEATSRLKELSAFGHVVDIQPLIEFRSRYDEFDADRKISEAELLTSSAEYDRLRLLHENAANISGRQFQEARTKWLADKARMESSVQKINNLRDQAVQIWGGNIVDAAINNTGLVEKLRSGESVLLLVTLSAGQHLRPGTENILIRHSGEPAQAQQAVYISPAPYTRDLLQGETYYFHTQRNGLRTGMRLEAEIPLADTEIEGVIIPASAVVWYADRPWVYIRRDDGAFFRLPLDKSAETGAGWFVGEGITSDDHIVIRGGQMLLSEEFRWSIPDEDDNP